MPKSWDVTDTHRGSTVTSQVSPGCQRAGMSQTQGFMSWAQWELQAEFIRDAPVGHEVQKGHTTPQLHPQAPPKQDPQGF